MKFSSHFQALPTWQTGSFLQQAEQSFFDKSIEFHMIPGVFGAFLQ